MFGKVQFTNVKSSCNSIFTISIKFNFVRRATFKILLRVAAHSPRTHTHTHKISHGCYENNSYFKSCRAIVRWEPKELHQSS